MIALNNVLVATDFSKCGDAAVKYGRELAGHFGTTLHLLHVVEDPYRFGWGVESVPMLDYDVVEKWQQRALADLRADGPGAAGPATVAAAIVGVPVEQILRYAREHAIGLIVLGTQGRGGVAHAFLGSVAERVVRRAPCPVLTVHHLQHEFIREPETVQETAAAR